MNFLFLRRSRLFLAVFLLLMWGRAQAQVNVLTQHNDNARTGANLSETTLNTSNVNVNTFGKLFSRAVDGQLYAQPLYVPNVAIPGKGTHNVVYLATQRNNVYAFDADDPAQIAPLWQVNLGPSALSTDFTSPYGGAPNYYYGNISPDIGITGTPVIDAASGTLYCVAVTKESNGRGGLVWPHRLHALDITTGVERPNSPVAIQGSVPGTGAGSVNGVLAFDNYHHLQRPSLLLSRGIVYVGFASHGDAMPFHGWLFGYNAGTLQMEEVFCTTPNGNGTDVWSNQNGPDTKWKGDQGGIWQAGQGPAADADGNVYIASGNGSFIPNGEYSNSVIKLGPGLSVLDWFTPYNQDFMSTYDQDLGSCGPLLIPGTNLVLQSSKGGVFYLMNRSNLGRYQAGSDSQIVQRFKATISHVHGSPIYWNSPTQGPSVYVWSEDDRLKQFKMVNGLLQTAPVSQSSMAVEPGTMPGGMLSLSANGSILGTGVVWASTNFSEDAAGRTVPGIVRAFDATDLSRELWNSRLNIGRDDIGNFAKWVCPTVANGKVYMATFSNQLVVYGLLPRAPVPAAPANLRATAGDNAVTLQWQAAAGASSYTLKRALNSGGPYSILARNLTSTSFTDSNALNGTIYYYIVVGVNSGGEGPASNEASARPVAPPRKIISVDFVGGGPNGNPAAPAATEVAGIVPATHWNGALGNNGTLASLNESGGAATSASINWTANGTYSTSVTENAGNNRMMKGYLNTTATSTTTLQVANLPAAFTGSGYDVYLYFDGNNGAGSRTASYTLNGTTVSGTDAPGSDFAGTFTRASNGAGNYVLFSNLTSAAFTLSATPGAASDSTPRAPINGIQIVSHIIATQPPSIRITEPAASQLLNNLNAVRGTATDNSTTGLDRVQLTLKRDADNQYWNGSAWVAAAAILPTTLNADGSWSKTSGLPAAGDLLEGAYTLTATVFDQSGNQTSTSSSFAVDLTAPIVTIEDPTGNMVMSGLPIISGTAVDNVDGRPLDRLDVVIKRLSDNKRWAYTSWVDAETGIEAAFQGDDWSVSTRLPAGDDLQNGAYEIKAVAFDQAGNIGVARVSITIDKSAPPLVSISTPGNGQTVSTLSPISGTVTSGGGVDRVVLQIQRRTDGQFWNGTAWSTTRISLPTTLSGSGNMTWTRSTGLPAGADLTESVYNIYAYAYDVNGNQARVLVSVRSQMVQPTVAFSSPRNGASVTNLSTLSGTASDNAGGSGLGRVNLYIRRRSDNKYWTGSAWGAMTPLPATLSGNTWTRSSGLPGTADLVEGFYNLYAFAYDVAGNRATATISVKANMVAPTVAITSPRAGATIAALSSVSGTASDNAGGVGVGRVDLVVSRKRSDGRYEYWTGSTWSTTRAVLITSLTTTASGVTWTRSSSLPSGANLANGTYILTAYAYDRLGNYKSAAISVAVKAATTSALSTSPATALSAASASVSGQSVQLAFSGALNAASAADAARYAVTVNGRAVAVSGASYAAATNTVTLTLPAATLSAGDSVLASWRDLRDAAGSSLSGQTKTLTAR